MKSSILIIEDEAAIRKMLKFALEDEPFDLFLADDIPAAEHYLADHIPSLILLDWMLPCKSGIEFIHWLKKQDDYQSIPIIMLTAKAEEENKVRGLKNGADDYVTKPFSPDELIARIHAVLRRGPLLTPNQEYRIQDFVINFNRCDVSVGDQKIALTANEFKTIRFFIKNPNKTFSRSQLITHVHGGSSFIDERSIDTQIKRLRSKLREHNYADLISTVRGVGYAFFEKEYKS